MGSVQAGDFAVGVSVGPAFGFDSDFNNEHTKTGLHLDLGFDALYRLDCAGGGFCEALFLETNFDMVFAKNYNFGATQVSSNGNTGNFSEKLKYYSGAFALRKHFCGDKKLQPLVSLGFGVSYIKLQDVSFTNTFGTQQNLNLSKSSINFDVQPGVGIAYEISPKLLVDMVARFHLLIPAGLENSFLELPIGIKYTF